MQRNGSSRRSANAVLLGCVAAAAVFGGSCFRPERARNLLLITIDTLRADHLGCYGYAAARTPVIDRLAGAGALFERAYTVAPTTLPAHASILTGLYPPGHGIRDNGLFTLPPATETLAEVLTAQGFATAAVVACDALNQRFGLDQGFSSYDAPGVQSASYLDRKAEEVTALALERLEQVDPDVPFFLWAHYFDPHYSYDPPAPFAGGSAIENYDGEIAYTDLWIGRLLEGLEALGRLDDTLIVLTADHGESLGEHGESYHSVFVYDATIRVPLLLVGPGVAGGTRISRLVRTVDIPCTALALLGAGGMTEWPRGAPPEIVPAPLLEVGAPRVAYSESLAPAIRYGWSGLQSVRTEEWLYIDAPAEELYRLDGSDPGQIVNRAAGEARTLAPLERLLDRSRSGMPRLPDCENALLAVVSSESANALAELGYLMGAAHVMPAPAGERKDPKDLIEVEERLQLAVEADRKGRFAEARAHVEWALANDAENALAWLVSAGLYEGRGQLGRAEDAYRRVLEIRPGHWKALCGLGTLQAVQGRLAAAEVTLRAAVEAAPRAAEAWLMLGNLLDLRGRPDQAIEAFERVLELDAQNELARERLGEVEK